MGGPVLPTGIPPTTNNTVGAIHDSPSAGRGKPAPAGHHPTSSFSRKRESRGKGGTNHTQTPPTTRSHFIPWCAGTSRHGRNVPICRPMVDGGMRKCSAGACPPLGSGWGVAESAVPIRCTKPQLRLFIPWCAGANQHE